MFSVSDDEADLLLWCAFIGRAYISGDPLPSQDQARAYLSGKEEILNRLAKRINDYRRPDSTP